MKYADNSWDFRGENTKEYTHCYHSYPARMIPLVARRVLNKYGSASKLLFDPYCGTGTSLVEAKILGINAVGTDLNPLARLIAKSKTELFDIDIYRKFMNEFKDYCFDASFNMVNLNCISSPYFSNIDFWFSLDVKNKLAIIKYFIDTIDNPPIKRFFMTAFSETVRKSSYTKNGEFKLVRMSVSQREKFCPDVFGIMLATLERNLEGYKTFSLVAKKDAVVEICDFNTVKGIPKELIDEGSVDIVLTSPPYGDSRTTVAYGQYSRLANQWLGIENASQIDSLLMGGVKNGADINFKSMTANRTISAIKDIDANRVKDVIAFFVDYEKSIDNVARMVKSGGFVCYVVGNRTVKGVKIPTDEITCELFEKNGFMHIETIIRNIPNKRMPMENSPTNIAGKRAVTMHNEYIVICKKQ